MIKFNRPAGNQEQLKIELKEHFTKQFEKLESVLKSQALLAEEDRQRVSSVHAEVVKARSPPHCL